MFDWVADCPSSGCYCGYACAIGLAVYRSGSSYRFWPAVCLICGSIRREHFVLYIAIWMACMRDFGDSAYGGFVEALAGSPACWVCHSIPWHFVDAVDDLGKA